MARKNNGRILSVGVIVACTVLFCTLNVSAQFQAVEVTHTITGSVGLGGVTMNGLRGPNGQPVTTEESGYYIAVVKWGWSGVVTPQLDGWNFDPPSKSYSEITGDYDNQDYKPQRITFTISGTANMEGVRMAGLPGEPITGADGTYSAIVEYGWNGTVVPAKDGYEFTPAEKLYPNVRSNMPREDYTAKKITITISGTTGVAGVSMQGLPGNVVTDGVGNYTATVDWGWNGIVRPVKQGYTFMPEEMPYTDLTFNQANQDYTSTPITFAISGSAGMANVEMKGFPDTVSTDLNGYYNANVNWGWSGTVTPQLDGYSFKPASQSYSKVDSNRDNQNYEGIVKTFTIAGTAGQEGVQMFGLPGDPVTGPGGAYSVTVEWNWSNTVTPTKDGFEFKPADVLIPPVTRDLKNQNFTASPMTFTISGTTDVPSVTLQGSPGRPVVSSSNGSYSVNVPWGWSGTIIPKKDGYEFSPPSTQYTDVRDSEINRSYIATLLKRTVSGTVISDKGQPVEGVLITGDLGITVTTDAGGKYELQVDHGWRGIITPVSEGHTFRPSDKRYTTPVTRDMVNQNFSAVVQMFTITDKVTMAGIPIPNVKITATDIPGSTATDAQGNFSIKVPYNWTGEVTLQKDGFNFSPPSKSYPPVTADLKMGQPEPVTPAPAPARRPTPARGGLPEEVPPTPSEIQPARPTLPPTLPEPNLPAEDTELIKLRKQLEAFMDRERRGPVGAPGEPYDPGNVLISDTFTDDDLATTVLETLSQSAGIPIVPEDTVFGLVTCTLDRVPLDRALQIVLAGTPYIVKKTPYYYLVSPGDPNSPLFPIVSETRPVKLDYTKAASAVALLSDVFLPYIKSDPDPNSHTVLVTAPTGMMERIISDLEQIDRIPIHVMLDARIVVMERGDLLNLGIEWGWPTIRSGLFSSDLFGRGAAAGLQDYGGKWPWGVQIGYSPDATFTNSLEIALNLFEENDEAKILSKPQVMALDGRQARIQVLKEEYFLLTPQAVSTFGYATSYMETVASGTTLTITPYVGSDNDITLEMAVEVSDSIPSARGTDLPVVTRRTAENTVRIKDGGTAIVAGLTENRTTNDYKRVPGLSKLPLIGPLFNNRYEQDTTREIAVFVTARIVREDGGVEFTGPSPTSMMQAPSRTPAEAAGDQFKASLLDSLSRQAR